MELQLIQRRIFAMKLERKALKRAIKSQEKELKKLAKVSYA